MAKSLEFQNVETEGRKLTAKNIPWTNVFCSTENRKILPAGWGDGGGGMWVGGWGWGDGGGGMGVGGVGVGVAQKTGNGSGICIALC
jgi:hypothetical protein